MAAFWKAFGVTYQIVPEAQPPHLDWYTGQPLTYDVNHTDGYFLIDAKGHERFIDINAPDLKGNLNKKLTSLLDAGGVHGLEHPQHTAWTVDQALASISWLLGVNVPRRHVVSAWRRPSLTWVAALFTVSLALAACGGGSVTTLSSPPTTDPNVILGLIHSPSGPILATGGGHALYDFAPDTPTQSACTNDGCVFQWPPLLQAGPIRVGAGVNRSLVGTLKRADGSTQLSYGGHPLYTYNLDVQPGLITGQAIDQDGGLWYVIDPAGHQITTAFSVNG